MPERCPADQLNGFTRQLFERAGLGPNKATTTATLLVEADLMDDPGSIRMAGRWPA